MNRPRVVRAAGVEEGIRGCCPASIVDRRGVREELPERDGRVGVVRVAQLEAGRLGRCGEVLVDVVVQTKEPLIEQREERGGQDSLADGSHGVRR